MKRLLLILSLLASGCLTRPPDSMITPLSVALATQPVTRIEVILMTATQSLSPTPELDTETPESTPTFTSTSTSTATPTKTATPRPPATLPPPVVSLVNGGFEDGLTGWTRWDLAAGTFPALNIERLSQGASRDAVKSGDATLRLADQYRCWASGVYQVVDAPLFTRLRISLTGRSFASQSNSFPTSDPSVNARLWLGIDSQGGVDAGNSGVRWTEGPAGDVWQTISVEGVALSPQVTVFAGVDLGGVRKGMCNWPEMNLMGFLDDVVLTVVK